MNETAIAVMAKIAKQAVEKEIEYYDRLNKTGNLSSTTTCTTSVSYIIDSFDGVCIRRDEVGNHKAQLISLCSNSTNTVSVFRYEVTLKTRVATAMNALVNGDNWMALDDESLFRAALLGVKFSQPSITDKEWEAVLWELKTMKALGVAAQGIPVDFQTLATMAPKGYEPLGLRRLWDDAQEARRTRLAEAAMRDIAPTLDAMAKLTQEKIKI